MRVGTQRIIRGIGLVLVVMLALGVGLSTVFAQGAPTRVSGGGQGIAGTVTYTLTAGGTLDVTSGTGAGSGAAFDSTGNRITFGFNAKIMKDGTVRGQMQIVDETRGLTISSDVAVLIVPHPASPGPVGATGTTFFMQSSTNRTIVDGVLKPGWFVKNSPAFDGGEGATADTDTVCFELFNAGGIKQFQWSVPLSSGNVQVVL